MGHMAGSAGAMGGDLMSREDSPDDNLPAPGQGPEIIDPSATNVTFVDWLVAIGSLRGVINIDLGSIDHTAKKSNDELARIIMGARLRMTVDFATHLHHILGQVISAARGEGPEPQQTDFNRTLN